MKTKFLILTFSLLILGPITVIAQVGYGGNSGMYGGGRNGMNSGMNSGMNRPQGTERQKPKEDSAEKDLQQLKAALNLDELQVIAISNILTESEKSKNSLHKKEGSQEDKMKDYEGISDATDLKIMNLLYKEQKEKYKNIIKDRKLRMESR